MKIFGLFMIAITLLATSLAKADPVEDLTRVLMNEAAGCNLKNCLRRETIENAINGIARTTVTEAVAQNKAITAGIVARTAVVYKEVGRSYFVPLVNSVAGLSAATVGVVISTVVIAGSIYFIVEAKSRQANSQKQIADANYTLNLTAQQMEKEDRFFNGRTNKDPNTYCAQPAAYYNPFCYVSGLAWDIFNLN